MHEAQLNIFYFGCIDRPGHYFWRPGPRHDWEADQKQPWGYAVDSCLCPGYVRSRVSAPQIEGEAALHHKDGWTALAFWDRSVDSRGGCNSVFLIEGTHDFDAAVAAAKLAFPQVWGRFKFEVRLTAPPAPVDPSRRV